MRCLIACEFSGRVRDAFLRKGHDAYSCDLLPAWGKTDRHFRQDVRPLLRQKWDLIIAHPPCTYLANSGSRWLYDDDGNRNEKRWLRMQQAVKLFLDCLEANAPRVCVENPIMHRWARELIGVSYLQIVQPWWFGGEVSKSTCLWLKGLPPLVPEVTEKPEQVSSVLWTKEDKSLPKHRRGLIRSVTSWGLARAMAEQWGK